MSKKGLVEISFSTSVHSLYIPVLEFFAFAIAVFRLYILFLLEICSITRLGSSPYHIKEIQNPGEILMRINEITFCVETTEKIKGKKRKVS